MQAQLRPLDRLMRRSALFVFCVLVSMALASCGGSTTAKSTGAGVTSASTSGTNGPPGTGATGGTAGSGGGTSGGSGGTSGSGSGGSGSGGTGGSGGSGSGGSAPVVIQSFSKPERLGGNGESDLIVDAKGNLDIANAHRPGLDPLFTTDVLRLTPGATKVTANTALPQMANNPRLAADSGASIYVTWLASPTSSNPSFVTGAFSRSDDGGATFSSPPVTVFNSGDFPHIALDSTGNIFVSWVTLFDASTSPSEVFVSRSTDGGKTFTASPPISDPAKKAVSPRVAVTSKGSVDVLWQYTGNGLPCDSPGNFQSCMPCDIWFAQSTDGGKSFSVSVNVSKSSGCAGLDGFYEDERQIQLDSSDNLNLVWDDSVAGVMFSRSTDGGSTFSKPKIVSPLQGLFPKISVDATGHINVVWEPPSTGSGFFFSRSTDGGATFSQPMPLGAGTRTNPVVATDANGDIDLVWIDSRILRFSQSFDDGKTFSTPVDVNTLDVTGVNPELGANTPVEVAVEPDGTVDLAFTADQVGGTGEVFLWFSHGATSSAAPPPPSGP
jgi:hypothetical protein